MPWLTNVSTVALTENSGGWDGFTLVERIEAAQLANQGGSRVRVTLAAGVSAEDASFDAVYIGMAAAAGDAYDFETTPVQLLFSSSGSVVIPANTQTVSDVAVFSVAPSKALLIAVHFNDGTKDAIALQSAGLTGWGTYYKAAVNEASTVNKSSFDPYAVAAFVTKVESFFAAPTRAFPLGMELGMNRGGQI